MPKRYIVIHKYTSDILSILLTCTGEANGKIVHTPKKKKTKKKRKKQPLKHELLTISVKLKHFGECPINAGDDVTETDIALRPTIYLLLQPNALNNMAFAGSFTRDLIETN